MIDTTARLLSQVERVARERDALADRLRSFPVARQHNLCSTATKQERDAYLRSVIEWTRDNWEAIASPPTDQAETLRRMMSDKRTKNTTHKTSSNGPV